MCHQGNFLIGRFYIFFQICMAKFGRRWNLRIPHSLIYFVHNFVHIFGFKIAGTDSVVIRAISQGHEKDYHNLKRNFYGYAG
jgi:hypothetical protein